MRQYFYIAILLPIIVGCNAHQKLFEKGQAYDNFRGFVPVDPIEYNDKVFIRDSLSIISKEIKLLTSDEILQFLNNETVLVSIGQVTTEGGISYLPITISSKHSSYKVTMDYMKFATLPQIDEGGGFIGFNRVGVGLRLVTLLTVSEAGINIGDLSSIGVAAKAGKVKGTLMIEVVGIKSKEVTTLLPLPSEINQTTIQNAMQALATIKSKIYDSETKLYPQVMAIKQVKLAQPSSFLIKELKDISDSAGTKYVANINKVDDEIKLQIGSNKFNSNRSQLAQTIEIDAFNYLFNRNIIEAIAKFEECERIYPGFHSAYEIGRILKAEKSNLLNPKSTKWKDVYAEILNEYSWRLPSEVIERLKKEVGD